MSTFDVAALLSNEWVLLAGLVVSVGFMVWLARRIRAVAKSERPDKALSRLAMLIGLGWSSEAVWELTGRIPQFPAHMRFLVFFVLEVVLVLSMIRADQNMREHRFPGRAGTTAWIVASVMGLVAAAVSHSFAEALLRAAIPLLLTLQWWDGLIGPGARRRDDATSWRWTPRRLLLWLGAIEPGERDVQAVHRERLTQQMTNLEFRRRHGNDRQRERAARRLARLGLTADDQIVDAVRDRVDRAMWFENDPTTAPVSAPAAGIPERQAASARARRVRHGRSLRRVMVAHPRPVIVAAQDAKQDDRSAQERDLVVRAVKNWPGAVSQRQIARLTALPETSVRASIRRIKAAEAAQQENVNGHVPDLEGAK